MDKRISGLDLLKIIATVMIIFHHYQQITGAWWGASSFYGGLFYYGELGLFRGNGGLKTATTPVFIHAKRHSVFDLEVECVYQSIQGTPYRAYFVCF